MSDDNQNESTPRTIGGEPVPSSSSWIRPAERPRVGRIGDWSSSPPSSGRPGGAGRGHAHSGGGSDDENEDKRETWFAGGERSGISIQNPGRNPAPQPRVVRDILRRAAQPLQAAPPQSGAFSGGGHRLGNEEQESSFVPDPNAAEQPNQDIVPRRITFWRQGFQVEDGELMRYDDPANTQILADIDSGNAPLSILNIRQGQLVDVKIAKRTEEDYVPPKGPRTFTGSGNRLGAPVPEATSATSSAPAASSSSSVPQASQESQNLTTRFEVDQSLPTTSVQIRLADGTRMVCRMNLTHTVGDIRNFINASRPENRTRPYTIATTFPNRVLDDDSATVKAAELLNSVVVQRWA